MHNKSFVLAFVALCPLLAATQPTKAARTEDFTIFNPPKLKPFLHIDLMVGLPVNVTTIYGVSGRFATLGGNVTGAIEGQVLPVGAAFELVPDAGEGAKSFLDNQYTLNTTSGTTLLMDARAIITYANNALHGFGDVRFSSGEEEFLDLNFRSFVGELLGSFSTGDAAIDVFELETGGRKDGQEIPALLPPGQASS